MTFSLLRNSVRLVHIVSRQVSFAARSTCLMTASQRSCGICSDTNIDKVVDSFNEFENADVYNELFENIDFSSIVGDDEERLKALKLLVLELNMTMQTQTIQAPKSLKTEEWRALLKKKTAVSRKRYLNFLYALEKRRELWQLAKQQKREQRFEEQTKRLADAPKRFTTSSPPLYQLKYTSLFYRIFPRLLKKRYDFNLALATMYGPDCIIDCSYEDFMTDVENAACARQIFYLWSSNRMVVEPFNIILCNMNPHGKIMSGLSRLFHSREEDSYLLNITQKSYLDLYPAKNLVYLTPHCHEELEEFNGNDVYIIGGYVDEIVNKPISLAKAKQDGLRCAKFPIDRYLNWAQGSKLLPINQCVNILNDLKSGSCWLHAFRHIAIRKQKFQFLDCDIKPKNDKLEESYVRQSVRRTMLRDLNIKKPFEHKRMNKPSDFDENVPSDLIDEKSF